jgi:hypothetical protein
LGNTIKLLPAKGGAHLVAHLEFQRAALLAGVAGSVGSGGRDLDLWARGRRLQYRVSVELAEALVIMIGILVRPFLIRGLLFGS